jgi:hypothetical protein
MRRAAFLLVLACLGATAACGGSGSTPPVQTQPKAPLTPVLVNAQVGVGTTRFLVSLVDQKGGVASAPDLALQLFFTPPGGSPQPPVKADYTESIPGDPSHGLYIAHTTFGKEGNWNVTLAATKGAAAPITINASFTVVAKTSFPEVGQPAVKVRSKKLSDVNGDISAISTDTSPDPALYQHSIDEEIDGHRPFVVVFATPKFCTSRVCGPTLDMVKQTRSQFPSVDVIHVEVVDPKDPLSANNDIKPVDAFNAWGMPDEPWVFVVDKAGIVRGAFEGVVTTPELVAAVKTAAQ